MPRAHVPPTREAALVKAVRMLEKINLKLPDDFRILAKRGRDHWEFTFSYAEHPGGYFDVFVYDNGDTKRLPSY